MADFTATARINLVVRGTPLLPDISEITGATDEATEAAAAALASQTAAASSASTASSAATSASSSATSASASAAAAAASAAGIDTSAFIKTDGSRNFAANQSMNNNKLTGLAAATTAGDAVRYEQAVLVANNLSDVTAATARTNLGVAYGKQTVWIPAGAMIPRTTNGAALNTVEVGTNKVMIRTLDFDAATQEFAQFNIRMPKSWNESTVTFIPVWSHAATVTNFGVVWGLDAFAFSDDDAMDQAFGTEQTSTDTGGTTNDLYQGPESSAITIAGTPAAGDWVAFRIHRNVASGSDTMAVDARLHGIVLLYTNDASNDT